MRKGGKTLAEATHPIKKSHAEWLLNNLIRNAGTKYGHEYGFERIRDADDYRACVPLISYEDILPLIQDICEGRSDVLFAGKPVAFEKTGGSEGGEKIIPYSHESIKDFRNALFPWVERLSKTYALGSGQAYMAISPALRAAKTTASGVPIGLPDGAYLGEDALEFFTNLSAVPPEVGAITSFEEWQIATLYHLLRAFDLKVISVWSPTFMTSLLDGILARKNELATLFRSARTHEDTEALKRLDRWDGIDTTSLWPNLKLVSCWTDGASAPYAAALAERTPQAAIEGKGLLLTEGVVTVPDMDGYPLPALESGFFEFLDRRGHSHLYSELDDGEIYEVVMTTAGGLYRYRAGDSVRCCGYINDLPVLRFVGRCGVFSDLVGEKLSDAFVADCLARTRLSGILTPIPDEPGYCLLTDTSEWKNGKLIELENALCLNPQYIYALKMRQLRPLQAKHVPDLTKRYTQYAISHGRRLGDVKIPALCVEPQWLTEVSKL